VDRSDGIYGFERCRATSDARPFRHRAVDVVRQWPRQRAIAAVKDGRFPIRVQFLAVTIDTRPWCPSTAWRFKVVGKGERWLLTSPRVRPPRRSPRLHCA